MSAESDVMMSDRTLRSAITDVPGVQVGHFTVAEGEVQSGITAVLPCPPSVRHRKLFLGAFASGEERAWTGAQVSEDFGTLASPIVLCNATSVGVTYDALITRGSRRDPTLPVDDGWPPVVIGIDDGYLNDLRRRRIGHDDVLRAVEGASDAVPARGSVGIGRGLVAFGGKGGVGDASGAARVGAAEHVVGVLVAANGGAPADGSTPGVRAISPGFVVIVATDAPLWPGDLRAIAESATSGLGAATASGVAESRLALAFSTGNAMEDSTTAPPERLYDTRRVGEEGLAMLVDVAARTARMALRRALEGATVVAGRKGRAVAPLGPEVQRRIAPAL
jgi:D-aminopeptidase